MRVVAGHLRGRRINAPDVPTTRPTTDKVREAMFNALGSLGEIENARVIDLFAGSGAVGIEALSRGAAHCTFVEREKRALSALRANLDHLGLKSVSTVVEADAASYMAQRGRSGGDRIDLLIADPPYGFDRWDGLLAGANAGLAVLESDREPDPIDGWEVVRAKKYGRTWVTFLRASGEPTGTGHREEGHSARNVQGTVEDE